MILLSAVFSGLEIAFVSSDKIQIEIINKRGGLLGKVLSKFVAAPSRFLTTLLIGNNVSLVVYGIYMDAVLTPGLSEYVSNTFLLILLQTIISTIIILVFSEYLPKTIFRIKPNHALRIFAYPIFGLYWSLRVFVYFAVSFSNWFLKRFLKMELSENKTIFGRVEIEQYLIDRTEEKPEGENIDTEIQMYKNVLDFSSVKVKECMVPRTEIVALDIKTDINELNETFIETGLSKVLIYRKSIEEIIGFVHSVELFKKPKDIKSILLPVGYIPESMNAQHALNNFIQQRKSIMVVVDEFGGTAGMLTIEDVMEEILGEIEDEHDKIDLIEEQHTDTEFLFSGRHEVDYLNDRYDLKIPTSDSYETLAGYIFKTTESIPNEGETINMEPFSVVVEKVSKTRIDLIKIHLHKH
jgi:CBS domain containing-hemolysin-like protein